jgi:hypothetical protein
VLWPIFGLPPPVLEVARSSAMTASMPTSLLMLLSMLEGLLLRTTKLEVGLLDT